MAEQRRPIIRADAVGLSVALLLTTLVGAALLMLFAQAGSASIDSSDMVSAALE